MTYNPRREIRNCVDCGEPHMRGQPAIRCEPCAARRRANPVGRACHKAVSAAVKRGELAPIRSLRCVDCGRGAHNYDHRDYTKPLEVEPVCASCNKLRGPADVWPKAT